MKTAIRYVKMLMVLIVLAGCLWYTHTDDPNECPCGCDVLIGTDTWCETHTEMYGIGWVHGVLAD